METNPKKSNINPVADFSKKESKFWILLDSRIQKNLDYLLLWINPDYVDYCGFLNPKLIRIQSINNPEKITRARTDVQKLCSDIYVKRLYHSIVLNLDKRITVFYTEGLYRKWSFFQQKKPSAIHDQKNLISVFIVRITFA